MPEPNPTAQPVPEDPDTGSGRPPDPLLAARDGIREIVADLRSLDRRLASLADPLPEPNGEFDERAEVRGAIETVRCDLLADAVETLAFAAEGDSEKLQRQHRRRQRWRAAESAYSTGGRHE